MTRTSNCPKLGQAFAKASHVGVSLMPTVALVIEATLVVVFTIATALAAAQDRFIRAEENQNHDLVITTSSGRQVVVRKSDRKVADELQVGFNDIAISPDEAAVGWLSYYPNCCTSYPVPFLVEVYTAGQRRTFEPAIAPWHWCFVDGSSRIAAVSTTVHGPQHEIIELWEVSTGKKLEEFTWMEGESYARAPAWVVDIHSGFSKPSDQRSHVCSAKR